MLLTFEPGDDGQGQVLDAENDQHVPKERMARKDAKYFTAEELNLIKPYHQGYRDLPGHDYDARAAYLRKHIFPPLLSHWYRNPTTKGRTEAGNIQIWTDRIAEYAAANWKSKIHLYKPPTFRLTMSDYFYNYHYNNVLDEVKKIVKLEEGPDAEVTSNDMTAYRHRAVRQIMERKSPSETAKLEAARKDILQKGHTPDVQKQQWKKHGTARMKRAHLLQLKKLGVCSIQFCAVPQEDGTVMVTAYENLVEGQGFPGALSFSDQYPEETKMFAERLVDYVTALQEKVASMHLDVFDEPPAAETTAPDVADQTEKKKDTRALSMFTTAEGFPILPTTWYSTMNRDVVEKYWKTYLLTHYWLASGTPSVSAIPWKAITDNGLSNFVDSSYLPFTEYPSFEFTAYRQMDTQEMITFFQKAAKRQTELGPEMAFRFSHVWNRKKKAILPSMYPDQQSVPLSAAPPTDVVDPMFENVMAGKRKKRKGRGRAHDDETRQAEKDVVGARGSERELDKVGSEQMPESIPALGVLAAGDNARHTTGNTTETIPITTQRSLNDDEERPVAGQDGQHITGNTIQPTATSDPQVSESMAATNTKSKRPKGGRKKKRQGPATQGTDEDTRVPDGQQGSAESTLPPRRSTCFEGAAAKYPTPFSDRAGSPSTEGGLRASIRIAKLQPKTRK